MYLAHTDKEMNEEKEATTATETTTITNQWQEYALWLETLVETDQINQRLEKENSKYIDKIQKAIDILEQALSERVE